MLGEGRQIGRALLVLLLGPDQHLGDLDLVEQLGVQQRHLFGDLRRLEVQQRGGRGHDGPRRQRHQAGLLQVFRLVQAHLLDVLYAQQLGHREVASADQLVHKVHQDFEQPERQVGTPAKVHGRIRFGNLEKMELVLTSDR